jgi:two-component system, cell cycle response regulator
MPQRILVIDDSQPMHALLQARLNTEPVELHFAIDGEKGLATAATLLPDLVLLDIDMPSPDGFEVCRRLKTDPRTTGIPVIFLTGNTSTEQKIKGLELGATDYITKPFDAAELRARIRATLRAKYLMDLLAQKALIDGLTGLWNRVYFESRLASELAFIRNAKKPLSCLMVDLDHFKLINDRHGHFFGDQVLREIAKILTEICRGEDSICRYGGEEFVVLTPNTTATQAAELAERIRHKVQEHRWQLDGVDIQVTCSIGVADLRLIPPPGMVEMADQAMYQAKNAGRNRVMVAARAA